MKETRKEETDGKGEKERRRRKFRERETESKKCERIQEIREGKQTGKC